MTAGERDFYRSEGSDDEIAWTMDLRDALKLIFCDLNDGRTLLLVEEILYKGSNYWQPFPNGAVAVLREGRAKRLLSSSERGGEFILERGGEFSIAFIFSQIQATIPEEWLGKNPNWQEALERGQQIGTDVDIRFQIEDDKTRAGFDEYLDQESRGKGIGVDALYRFTIERRTIPGTGGKQWLLRDLLPVGQEVYEPDILDLAEIIEEGNTRMGPGSAFYDDKAIIWLFRNGSHIELIAYKKAVETLKSDNKLYNSPGDWVAVLRILHDNYLTGNIVDWDNLRLFGSQRKLDPQRKPEALMYLLKLLLLNAWDFITDLYDDELGILNRMPLARVLQEKGVKFNDFILPVYPYYYDDSCIRRLNMGFQKQNGVIIFFEALKTLGIIERDEGIEKLLELLTP